jgi:predicted transcriptional regulator
MTIMRNPPMTSVGPQDIKLDRLIGMMKVLSGKMSAMNSRMNAFNEQVNYIINKKLDSISPTVLTNFASGTLKFT